MFDLRSIVLLVTSVLIGIAAGALTYMSSGKDAATAVIAGGAAFAAAMLWLDKIVH